VEAHLEASTKELASDGKSEFQTNASVTLCVSVSYIFFVAFPFDTLSMAFELARANVEAFASSLGHLSIGFW